MKSIKPISTSRRLDHYYKDEYFSNWFAKRYAF